MKKTVILIAKLTITLGLLYFALSHANLGLLAERAQRLNVVWLLAAVVVLGVQTFITALRWRSIVVECGAAISVTDAARYTFISLFFSQMLPSTIGGDAARVWLTARDGIGWSTAIYSVIIDRVAGVLVLAL